ncbi:MAG: COX15/CtaA family protein [Acidobacteria bacterium]|nr:COX15/CtaA family protein [Acidobacteriota bacterium]
MRQADSVWVHWFAVLTAFATFVLIIAGALVVGHDAGLSVPDWPLSYGSLMPPMEGGIFYEHGHRMIAALVGALTIALAIWLWQRDARRWVRILGVIAVVAVITQAVLGGITVLYLLPVPVRIFHASLAQLFFCITLGLALFTSRAWAADSAADDRGFPGLRLLSCAATCAVFIQLILGAALRHGALGLMPHIAWAAAVAVLVIWMGYVALARLPRSETHLRWFSGSAIFLVILQLGLGYGSYYTRLVTRDASQPDQAMIHVTTTHVAVGAALLGASLLTTLLAFRRLRHRSEVVSFNRGAQKTAA